MSAQDLTPAQVPAMHVQAFHLKFPAVTTATWKLEADKNHEAELIAKGAEVAVKFDAAGKRLGTETASPRSGVPKPALNTLATTFKGYAIIETQSLQRWNEQALIYELLLENAKEVVKATFAADGAILSRSAEPKGGQGEVVVPGLEGAAHGG